MLEITTKFRYTHCPNYVEHQMRAFSASRQSLLREADVPDNGMVAMKTVAEVHLTAECVLNTSQKRKKAYRSKGYCFILHVRKRTTNDLSDIFFKSRTCPLFVFASFKTKVKSGAVHSNWHARHRQTVARLVASTVILQYLFVLKNLQFQSEALVISENITEVTTTLMNI